MDALHTLLKGVIDYAGLFPPARLPLDQAWDNYLSYSHSEDAWLLGSFVLPVEKLVAWESLLEETPCSAPFALAVIGRGGETPAAWSGQLREDFAAVAAFSDRQGDHVRVQSYETRLPRVSGWEISPHETSLTQLILEGLPHPTEVSDLVSFAVKEATGFRDSLPRVFFEPPRARMKTSAWYGALAEVGAFLSGRFADRFGLKLRTGGMEVEAVPCTREVALFLHVCHLFELRWKGTAGLHHPLRHHDPVLDTDLHGFMNLLMSAVLMRNSCVAHSPVLVLSDTEAEHFEFDDEGCGWGLTAQRVRADKHAIRHARTHGFCSFGSCDFDEPRAHLRRLGWLPVVSSAHRDQRRIS